MGDKYDDYRAFAAYCEKMFRAAQDGDSKTAWRRLATNWLALIPRAGSVHHENGDAASRTEALPEDATAPSRLAFPWGDDVN